MSDEHGERGGGQQGEDLLCGALSPIPAIPALSDSSAQLTSGPDLNHTAAHHLAPLHIASQQPLYHRSPCVLATTQHHFSCRSISSVRSVVPACPSSLPLPSPLLPHLLSRHVQRLLFPFLLLLSFLQEAQTRPVASSLRRPHQSPPATHHHPTSPSLISPLHPSLLTPPPPARSCRWTAATTRITASCPPTPPSR